MNCYLLTLVLIALIKTTIVGALDAHHLTNSNFNDLLVSTKDCSRIYYCSTYSTSNDCFSYCYDLNSNGTGNDYVNFCYAKNYLNPFKNSNCGSTTRAYLNYYNINCYTTPYSSKVINRAGSRLGSGLRIINGRCLTGAEWCPCNISKISNEKCGKVNNGIYECKSGYCCSKWGYCGTSKKHSGYGCQTPFDKCW